MGAIVETDCAKRLHRGERLAAQSILTNFYLNRSCLFGGCGVTRILVGFMRLGMPYHTRPARLAQGLRRTGAFEKQIE